MTNENNCNSFDVTGLDILLANDYEQKLNLQNIARPLYFLDHQAFWNFHKSIFLEENSKYFLYFSLQLFQSKM